MSSPLNRHPTVYRITNFIRRRSNLSEKEFYQHWQHAHAAPVALWAVGALRCAQISSLSLLISSDCNCLFI
ncbi:hypothetical protein NEOLEDRAFT_1134370 [Neolentinus lepideus HHB14362 ss-1]|uniref:EthD domain-containing protein n=1 Tax=Neolentinus lepideus HHB14362 ss-1 TaxID=1314782 RepID=A0A165S725_9AGAM|nr:hypothetical protein NEOLEDRAFT_1134370 [Neolentinus lepideus HHB14362 ss-1]